MKNDRVPGFDRTFSLPLDDFLDFLDLLDLLSPEAAAAAAAAVPVRGLFWPALALNARKSASSVLASDGAAAGLAAGLGAGEGWDKSAAAAA